MVKLVNTIELLYVNSEAQINALHKFIVSLANIYIYIYRGNMIKQNSKTAPTA